MSGMCAMSAIIHMKIMTHPLHLRYLGVMVRGKTFRAIAEAIVPETAKLDEAGWEAFRGIVTHAVSQRPARMRRQLAMFVRLLDLMSYAHNRRALHRLDLEARTGFLEQIQNSPFLLIRRGFWGIRTLILMGYYARPECMPAIGYAAHVRGWEMRACESFPTTSSLSVPVQAAVPLLRRWRSSRARGS